MMERTAYIHMCESAHEEYVCAYALAIEGCLPGASPKPNRLVVA